MVQQRVQLFGHDFASAGLRAGIAIAKARTIVRTNAGEFGNLRLHLVPGNVGVAKTGIENYRGSSLAGAMDVHLVPAHVDALTGHGMKTAVAGLGDVLINETRRREDNDKDDQASDDDAQPRAGLIRRRSSRLIRVRHFPLPLWPRTQTSLP